MHRIIPCLALLCWSGFAQTNSQPAATLFSTPSLDLRLNPVENNKSSGEEGTLPTSKELREAPRADGSAFARPTDAALFNRKQTSLKITSQGSDELTTDSFRSDVARAIYQRLDRDGFFNRPPEVYENEFDRFIDSTFSPEVFRVGKTEVACPLLTAIKRKSPLWLAIPLPNHDGSWLFLKISW
jgi:hypothetical protein